MNVGEGPGARTPLILDKKEETTEGRKAGRGSKTQPFPSPPLPFPLSSRSGSTTECIHLNGVLSYQIIYIKLKTT